MRELHEYQPILTRTEEKDLGISALQRLENYEVSSARGIFPEQPRSIELKNIREHPSNPETSYNRSLGASLTVHSNSRAWQY